MRKSGADRRGNDWLIHSPVGHIWTNEGHVVVRFVARKREHADPKRADTHVGEKRVFGPDGKARKMLTLDVNSPTFADDLLYVFRRAVRKARRENRRLLGVSDYTPALERIKGDR